MAIPHDHRLEAESDAARQIGVAATREAAAVERSTGFIATPAYDWVFFVYAPVLAFVLVELVAAWPWATSRHAILGVEQYPVPFFIAIWTHAHLFAVFFRSHANPKIFDQHRFAFVGVPSLLFVGFLFSDWLMIAGLFIGAIWAIYHLGMQNFGLCRIYDVRFGNPPEMGRRLDYWLHLFLNVGPFLAGLCLMPTLELARQFSRVGWDSPGEWITAYRPVHGWFTVYIAIAGLLFLVHYVNAYWRLGKQGYRLPPQKLALMITTGTVSITAWGFLPAWKAFFVMNFFHALQYFALVWWVEKANLRRLARLENVAKGTWLTFAGFVLTVTVIGVGYRVYGSDYTLIRWAASLALVIALMHYWYDGFVWSVRRREV